MGFMKAGYYFFIGVVVLVFLTPRADCSIISSHHNNTNTDLWLDVNIEDEQEFLMESEASRRVLAGHVPHITYDVIRQNAICSAKRYMSCIKDINGYYRPCRITERCGRKEL